MPAVEWPTIGDLLHCRACREPDDPAYAFLSTGGGAATLSFAQLEARALGVAARLLARGAPGDRAVLLFPPGLDFLVAFFGCLLAGVIAVPLKPPRRFARHDSGAVIVRDCAPHFALTDGRSDNLRTEITRVAPGIAWLEVSDEAAAAPPTWSPPASAPDDIAFLQYTSGSTADPKGIEVTHASLLHNLEMIRLALGNTKAATHVSWLPLYHDMGLILNALQTMYVGALCVLLAPAEFMQRPLSWLRAISTYRAEVAGGPDFGFAWCADRYRPEHMEGVDLSCWRVAINGAEPVRAATVERFCAIFGPYGFHAEAMYPAYGMAEATLLISGGARGDGARTRSVSRAALRRSRVSEPASEADRQALVACGRALVGEQITIVAPDTGLRLPPDEIGEIWVSGPNICRGYWRNAEATDEAFRAGLANRPGESWLRTGDLGFIDGSGDLFITGRIKDVIVIRGINHYPQDIEHSVETSHPELRRHCGASFAIDAAGEERLVVVQELERAPPTAEALAEIIDAIREALAEEHELAAHRIVLIRRGTIPKTTSGKIRRRRTRELWLAGLLTEHWLEAVQPGVTAAVDRAAMPDQP